jgi:hypothetical protein
MSAAGSVLHPHPHDTSAEMPKRRITEAEKWAIIGERMAKEGPRRPDHMVVVSVADETGDQGEPIVTVVRMRQKPRRR